MLTSRPASAPEADTSEVALTANPSPVPRRGSQHGASRAGQTLGPGAYVRTRRMETKDPLDVSVVFLKASARMTCASLSAVISALRAALRSS